MIEVFPTPERLADGVARHIVARAAEAIAASGRFTMGLAGGSTPRAAYSRLAGRESRVASHESRQATIDWGRVHVLWGDERCVPPDDPRSNYRMAKETLLDRVPIPPDHVHRIRGEDDPEKAAAEYEDVLRSLLGCHPERSEGGGAPLPVNTSRSGSFAEPALSAAEGLRMTKRPDLVLLGLGEDGHTASLFPGQAAVHETKRWVVAVPAPSGNVWRVTLTPAVLDLAKNVTFVVSGTSKAARLQQVIQGPFTPDLLPAQAIRPTKGRLVWMVDQAAATQLRPSTIPDVTRDS